ncbi:MAG: hypothetical protein POELPBGB_00737 [Bacteroidia bacterium]|nr:hypothetical protein [Bacteroidia bacterium]
MAAKKKQEVIKSEKPFPLWAKAVLAVLFVAYASVFMAREINFVTADLGRHITNGKVTVETGNIISTNFYSYTEPDFPAINHHWGSGVIFYIIHEAFGFSGLSVFYVFTVVGAALLFGMAALRFADARLVFFAAVLAAPLLAYRTEVRPEGISLLFAGVFFYMLVLFREHKLSYLAVLILFGVAQLLWVNSHIFFFMGFMLTGFFMAEEYVVGKNKEKLKHYVMLLAVLLIASLLNPFFIKGLLAPLTIFKEYGYMIAENQSVLFMQERMPGPVFTHFEITGFVLLLLFAFLIIQKKLIQVLVLLLPVVAFGLLGFVAVRGIPLFALAAIPALAFLMQHLIAPSKSPPKGETFHRTGHSTDGALAEPSISSWAGWGFAGVGILIVLTGFQSGYATDKKNKRPRAEYREPSYFAPIKYTTGTGLFADMNLSADFFKQNNIKGPVFNNYDIGGYLIYHLYGKEKVFVDNRPEAYSVDFFKKTYVPMQEKMEKFREVEQQYGFNCIWFYRHDNTPWAQPFLLQLLEQPDYVPVFVDGFTIMFLKRNEQNAELIKKYELPKSMFRSVPG